MISLKLFLGILCMQLICGYIILPNLRTNIGKKLGNIVVTVSLSLGTILHPSVADAADLVAGKAIFDKSCAACHSGGGNIFNSGKDLRQKSLAKNKCLNVVCVENLVEKGKKQMPAYGTFTSPKGKVYEAKLTPDEIADVAAYTLDEANNGWEKNP